MNPLKVSAEQCVCLYSALSNRLEFSCIVESSLSKAVCSGQTGDENLSITLDEQWTILDENTSFCPEKCRPKNACVDLVVRGEDCE